MVIGDLLSWGTKALQEAGIKSARLDAEVLLCHLLQKERIYLLLHKEESVAAETEAAFRGLVARRKQQEPVAYIVGEKEFMSLPFRVCPGVLIPRPDTETLVEFAIETLKNKENPEILDLCTGSGAIAVSLAHYLQKSRVTAYDISDICVMVARKNAEKNGVAGRVTVEKRDVLAAMPEKKYDAIFSNPPYIPAETLKGLMAEVRDFEPHSALDGGDDGLTFYRHLVKVAPDYLKPGGLLAFEIGHDQKETVSALFYDDGRYENIGSEQDLAGVHRVIYGFLK